MSTGRWRMRGIFQPFPATLYRDMMGYYFTLYLAIPITYKFSAAIAFIFPIIHPGVISWPQGEGSGLKTKGVVTLSSHCRPLCPKMSKEGCCARNCDLDWHVLAQLTQRFQENSNFFCILNVFTQYIVSPFMWLIPSEMPNFICNYWIFLYIAHFQS